MAQQKHFLLSGIQGNLQLIWITVKIWKTYTFDFNWQGLNRFILAGWILEFYNFMIEERGKEIISNGWKAAGITEALELGATGIQPLDPSSDIDPLLSNSSFIDEIPIPAIDEMAGYERTDDDDLDEDEWIHPNYNAEDDRNMFDVLDDE